MKNELINKVIEQIKLDLKFDYTECIVDLLSKISDEDLSNFVNESLPRSEKSIIDVRLDKVLKNLKKKDD